MTRRRSRHVGPPRGTDHTENDEEPMTEQGWERKMSRIRWRRIGVLLPLFVGASLIVCGSLAAQSPEPPYFGVPFDAIPIADVPRVPPPEAAIGWSASPAAEPSLAAPSAAPSLAEPSAVFQAAYDNHSQFAGAGLGEQCPCATLSNGPYAGADFLLIRPTFSQATAFAEGTETPSSLTVVARPLQFDYAGSLRAFAGYHLADRNADVQFTYWHLQGATDPSGAVFGPGQFLVDPFGNIAGTYVDPSTGAVLTGGDVISTYANTTVNIYDLDYRPLIGTPHSQWRLRGSVGVRIADIDQFYSSLVSLGGLPISYGDFAARFIGAGPRVGLEARRFFGSQNRWSLFSSAHGGLLVGQYDVRSSNRPIPFFVGSQSESVTRTIPVVDLELGASLRATDRLSVSAGWLFQTWWDLGTSGGTFGGLFRGADDANIMSFDGLFVRGEFAF